MRRICIYATPARFMAAVVREQLHGYRAFVELAPMPDVTSVCEFLDATFLELSQREACRVEILRSTLWRQHCAQQADRSTKN